MSNPNSLPPGFRFHPTDEELILHYLKNRAASTPCPVSIIAEVDIYKLDPWELPDKALFGDREWYFFSPRDRKYPNGVRPNRAAASGYWKATGTDKPITSGNVTIGVKKALVFYKGRPPKGIKTNWIMHEYRLAEAHSTNTYRPMKLRDMSMRLDDWVLCRIYKKSNHALSAEPPVVYQEQEREREREREISGMDDAAYMSNLPSIAQQQDTPKLQKSSSLSDFLEHYSALARMFDNMPEMPAPQNATPMGTPIAKQPFLNDNGANSFAQQLSGAPAAENYLKRQRAAEDESGGPSKKRNESCSFTNMGSQFDGASSQYNMMNQALLNQQQQLLLNSHLGLH